MTKEKATCKKCGQTYNIKGGQRTGLRDHLKKKHDIDIQDEKKEKKSTPSTSTSSMDSFVKREPKKPIEDVIAEEAARGSTFICFSVITVKRDPPGPFLFFLLLFEIAYFIKATFI